MKKISKGSCKTASHSLFKDKAKNHVDDLQMMFLDLQFVRKESRSIDAALLEEQVNQMLLEWRADLNEPSSAASLKQEGSHGSFSTDICRLLQLCEHEDDATSLLAVPRHEPNDQIMQTDAMVIFQENSKDRDHPHISTYLPSLCSPPVFLGPNVHFGTIQSPHKAPVLCPGGIGLKDNLLLAALSAKAEGKDVGSTECTWAFESGNRKQRSLPDYNRWGWHESRKQVMNEFGGLKRSYYMDPQPLNHFEWHLYEYEISKCDSRALYRLELKRVDGKKSSKAKITSDSVTNLQKRIGRLSGEFPYDSRRSAKGRAKPDAKADIGGVYTASKQCTITF
ncbi:hypothetical protein TSUD_385540 [Trifolium subterraneum]|uniref:Transcription factor VOZ1 n=1 Tax=Trifolium subterraneum TaxID=3900 RepID=A0A2Z6LZ05_TRISU|nr:hypothetical protein TSUD_385540 [Trifolium subterraneum]